MIDESSLATAHVAQIFGSELLKIQSTAKTDSGSSPQIVNIDPRQFLNIPNNVVKQNNVQEQHKLMEALQREAESAYPLPNVQPHSPTTDNKPAVQNSPSLAPVASSFTETPTVQAIGSYDTKVLESINLNLERLANSFDTIRDALVAAVETK